nr:PREDICTED: neutral ceramidase [Anolis carolinensis]|eukprot:XP_003229437.2 PREDICTED: neutral ceramidase [Anolis carolinensis]
MSKPLSTASKVAIVIVPVVMLVIALVTVLVVFFLPNSTKAVSQDGYLIGVGRGDCTGPVAEVPFMGYASMDQSGAGMISRQYCRAFIFADPNNSTQRVVFVTAEIGMISQRVRLAVMQQLKNRYGDLYGPDNVVLSGTHTHSGPGGYFQYTIYMISSRGFIKPSFNAIVNGILESIATAHENMVKGRVFINKGLVENTQINRSPLSYLNNPESERLRYTSNTDKEMVLLKMVADNGQEIGMLSWFAIHPVSMNNTNLHTSSDNIGYAAYLFEEEKNKGYLTGKGPYVAGFASSNLGDVSPNIQGPHCINTGDSCENLNNYCPIGGTKMCIAKGPGKDMLESTQIIGRNIYLKAKELYSTAFEEINGPIHSAHQWVDMSNITVQLNATHTGKTCKPALGYSFAAGTMDGPGMFNFTQGMIEGNSFWDAVRDAVLTRPSKETEECHKPKPILIPTGELSKPYPWHPNIIDIQIITVGSLAILALPGEFSTMSGRRLREAIKNEFESHGKTEMNVVLSGLCNIYTHYIATYEEYQIQRYEGASTLFGPHTLSAYIQLYRGLAKAIAEGTARDLPNLPEPPILNVTDLTFLPIIRDAKPLDRNYGDVLQDVQPKYRMGEVAEVRFVGANPRNSATNMTNFTFLTVEKYDNTSNHWKVMYNDASWDTRFTWQKDIWGRSTSIVQWHISNNTEPGTYRIQYFGHSKELLRPIRSFSGSSLQFEVSG